MSDAITIKLGDDGLAPRLKTLHEQISDTDMVLDISAARNFGAYDFQALIHLERAASKAGAGITVVGASDAQAAVLASRPSTSSDTAEQT